jgi:hypothetical protein
LKWITNQPERDETCLTEFARQIGEDCAGVRLMAAAGSIGCPPANKKQWIAMQMCPTTRPSASARRDGVVRDRAFLRWTGFDGQGSMKERTR